MTVCHQCLEHNYYRESCEAWDIFKIRAGSNEKKIGNDQETEDRIPDKYMCNLAIDPDHQVMKQHICSTVITTSIH